VRMSRGEPFWITPPSARRIKRRSVISTLSDSY
jgi:hypothetical protein